MIEPSAPSDSSLWRSVLPRATRRLSRVAGGVSTAAISTAKTQLLRRDRVGDGHHAARLNVCRSCPGGHATLSRHGTPRTSGPMLASLTVKGQPTCGCVLTQKARDLKQACSFGCWEQVDRRAA